MGIHILPKFRAHNIIKIELTQTVVIINNKAVTKIVTGDRGLPHAQNMDV